MSRAKLEVIDEGNIGLYANFGSDSEDECEQEDEETIDFVRCHPLPSPDDEGGKQLWKKVIDRLKKESGVNEVEIYMSWRFDIIKKMYENLTDRKVIIKCGKELNKDGKFKSMIINITLLSIAMDELNDTDKPCLTQIRVIEHWWNGIGEWKA